MTETPAEYKPATVEMGPGYYRPLLKRVIGLNGALLAASMCAAVYCRNWGWLAVGGTVMAAHGLLLMSSRIRREGLKYVDERLPPGTFGNTATSEFFNERIQRAEDNWQYAVGLCLSLAGTVIAGAVPFILQSFWPFAAG
jgi:hypothetical protein